MAITAYVGATAERAWLKFYVGVLGHCRAPILTWRNSEVLQQLARALVRI